MNKETDKEVIELERTFEEAGPFKAIESPLKKVTNKIKERLRSKKYHQENREKISKRKKKYRLEHLEEMKKQEKDRRERNIEVSRQKEREYYKKNAPKIIQRKHEEAKARGFPYQKKYMQRPEVKEKNKIRDKTKHQFKLEGKKCKFCDEDAKQHHHTTDPYEFDKFWYVCLKCHKKIHRGGQDVFLER